MIIKGKIKLINPTIQVSEKFSKREFVLTETSNQYPQDLLIQMGKDKNNLLDGLFVGQEVDVDINLRGREWINPQGEAKYFNTIEAWRITPLAVANVPVQNNVPIEQVAIQAEDDMPF